MPAPPQQGTPVLMHVILVLWLKAVVLLVRCSISRCVVQLPCPLGNLPAGLPLIPASSCLQAELGLPVDPKIPLFAFIGRLEEQKGVDILISALPKVLATSDVQVAILGTGKAKYEKLLNSLSKEFKGKAKGIVKFSAPMAHMLTAGADYMLVPSRCVGGGGWGGRHARTMCASMAAAGDRRAHV